jgi:hypothetical protein
MTKFLVMSTFVFNAAAMSECVQRTMCQGTACYWRAMKIFLCLGRKKVRDLRVSLLRHFLGGRERP